MRLNKQFLNFNRSILMGAIISVAAVGCNHDDNETKEGKIEDLSAFAQNFIGMKLSSSNAMRQTTDAAINQTFRATTGSHNARILADGFAVEGDSSNTGEQDSLIYYEPWVSCAVITETTNSDGSFTSIYDYGDEGCQEGWGDYKYYMHGKYTQNYKYTNEVEGSAYINAYLFDIVYDNYGGTYNLDSAGWNTDGHSSYEGLSTYDTLAQTFSGSYQFNDASTYSYGDQITEYSSKGKTTYNEQGSIVVENDYQYGDGDNFYHSLVTKPLVSNYSCNQNGLAERNSAAKDAIAIAPYYWVYVSGHEKINYKQDGLTGNFEIDYGTGECDNIIYIIEGDVIVEVDMGAMVTNYIK